MQSQEAVQAELAGLGIAATQATISRDLRAIGAVKGPGGYMVPETPEPSGHARSASVMAQHVTSIAEAAGLVVLKTKPGSAAVVALELDERPPRDVVGTVAGDDTVLVAVSSSAAVKTVGRSLRVLVGLEAGSGGGA